jgi:hypothetical protein
MIARLKRNLLNVQGWTTKRKIVVIESDDWGSIRMPSKETYNKLLKKGYNVNNDPYLKYDSLATADDLSHLFDVLSSIKDKNNRSPIITANTIVANPDFKKIQNSNFETYFFEPFLETLARYKECDKSFDLWNEGIDSGLFFPQFHGREHLNVSQWMKALQKKDKNIIEAFENEMISISSEPSNMKFSYMEGMDFFDESEKRKRKEIIEQGLSSFENIFKYKSLSYIANCYIWDDYVEEILSNQGVKYIQGVRVQKKPNISNKTHSYKFKSNSLGKKNKFDQIYLIRNVHFEPSHYPNKDVINDCLKEISIAFCWNKPAIISSHRINFIGAIDINNRIRNLKLFHDLLIKITIKWPDVEFMSSAELGDLIKNSKK